MARGSRAPRWRGPAVGAPVSDGSGAPGRTLDLLNGKSSAIKDGGLISHCKCAYSGCGARARARRFARIRSGSRIECVVSQDTYSGPPPGSSHQPDRHDAERADLRHCIRDAQSERLGPARRAFHFTSFRGPLGPARSRARRRPRSRGWPAARRSRDSVPFARAVVSLRR